MNHNISQNACAQATMHAMRQMHRMQYLTIRLHYSCLLSDNACIAYHKHPSNNPLEYILPIALPVTKLQCRFKALASGVANTYSSSNARQQPLHCHYCLPDVRILPVMLRLVPDHRYSQVGAAAAGGSCIGLPAMAHHPCYYCCCCLDCL